MNGPSARPSGHRHRLAIAALLAAACGAPSPAPTPAAAPAAPAPASPTEPAASAAARAAPPRAAAQGTEVVVDRRSPFSHIQVVDRGPLRSLLFLDERGKPWTQTTIDRQAPQQPQQAYVRGAFVASLWVPYPERWLIIGLGGGALVHALRGPYPALAIDGVEIDPVVAELARSHFQLADAAGLTIHVADGVAFLRDAGAATWSVVFLDAFLEPGAAGTDGSGVPDPFRTDELLQVIRGRLAPGGVAVWNLHHKRSYGEHVAAIRRVFPQVYEFVLPGSANRIVVGTLDPARRDRAELQRMVGAIAKEPPGGPGTWPVNLGPIIAGLLAAPGATPPAGDRRAPPRRPG